MSSDGSDRELSDYVVSSTSTTEGSSGSDVDIDVVDDSNEGGAGRRDIWSGHAAKKLMIKGEETVVPGVETSGSDWKEVSLNGDSEVARMQKAVDGACARVCRRNTLLGSRCEQASRWG